MNSETYLNQFRTGTLQDRLKKMAAEYDGPCGQGMTIMETNRLKKAALLEAIEMLDKQRSSVFLCVFDTVDNVDKLAYLQTRDSRTPCEEDEDSIRNGHLKLFRLDPTTGRVTVFVGEPTEGEIVETEVPELTTENDPRLPDPR
jgi:hypothetical protein